VKGHIPERDGILLGLLLLEAVAASGKGLRQLLDETMDDIGHFYYKRIDRRIEDVAKEQLILQLRSHPPTSIDGQRVVATNFSDGFKFIFENGDWLLIRPSGTEPVLRLYSEAGSLNQVERFLRQALMIAGG
jgi:phosphomannomutase